MKINCLFLFSLALIFSWYAGIAGATDITACGNINSGDYNITTDFSGNANCLLLIGNNITINGNGHTVTYAATTAQYGISATTKDNITIHDLVLKNGNASLSGFKSGIISTTSSNLTIYNVSIITYNNNLGMSLSSSNFISINNTTINTNGNFTGIQVTNTNWTNITNSSITANTGYGLQVITGSNHNNFTNNTVISNNVYSVYHDTTTYGLNTFQNNTLCCDVNGSSPYTHEIYFIGDSITAGASGATSYVPTVKNGLNSRLYGDWHVINAGIGGQRTDLMKARFTEELGLYNPSMVVILGGINDIAYGSTLDDIRINITTMANASKALGLRTYVLLLTPHSVYNSSVVALNDYLIANLTADGTNYTNTYDSIDLIPLNGNYDGYNSVYMVDTVHPNPAGATALGTMVYARIFTDLAPAYNPCTQTNPSLAVGIGALGAVTGIAIYNQLRRKGRPMMFFPIF